MYLWGNENVRNWQRSLLLQDFNLFVFINIEYADVTKKLGGPIMFEEKSNPDGAALLFMHLFVKSHVKIS